MPPVGFEPAIPASEWAKTHALDLSAIGIGFVQLPIKMYRIEEKAYRRWSKSHLTLEAT